MQSAATTSHMKAWVARADQASVGRSSSRPIVAFDFRGQAPLFDGHPVRLSALQDGDCVTLEARGPDGTVALAASATLG